MKSDAAAVSRIVALCREGLGRPDLPENVRLQLARAVSFDMACWGLLDPTTLWPVTNASTSPASAAALRAWEHELLVPDVTKLADLARSKIPIGALGLATGGAPERSPRYRAAGTARSPTSCTRLRSPPGPDSSRPDAAHRTQAYRLYRHG